MMKIIYLKALVEGREPSSRQTIRRENVNRDTGRNLDHFDFGLFHPVPCPLSPMHARSGRKEKKEGGGRSTRSCPLKDSEPTLTSKWVSPAAPAVPLPLDVVSGASFFW